MSNRIFEIYRKIVAVEKLDICNIHTDSGILYLNYDNPKFNELLSIIMGNKNLLFDCNRINKKFFIIDINLNKLIGVEATILNIEKEFYTENIHITTDPFRILVLNKNYSKYNKLVNKLNIGDTFLFLFTNNCNQLINVKKTLKYTDYIEVSDIGYLDNEFKHLDNYLEIKVKNTRARLLYDTLLNIGSMYKIVYSKAFGSNLYKIIESELVK